MWQQASVWNIFDRFSQNSLSQIDDMAERANSLLARNKTGSLVTNNFINVFGAIDMMFGFSYHHDNFVDVWNKIEPVSSFDLNRSLDHEVVAYINRIGQFYYFAKSDFVKQAVPDYTTIIPTILKNMVFRLKHSAHRSLDDPRSETDEEKIAHARALTSTFGYLETPRQGASLPELPAAKEGGTVNQEDWITYRKEFHKNAHRTYQTYDSKIGGFVSFTIEIDHPQIMSEAYSLIEKIIMLP